MYELINRHGEHYACENCSGTNFIPSEVVHQGHKCTSCRRGVDFGDINTLGLEPLKTYSSGNMSCTNDMCEYYDIKNDCSCNQYLREDLRSCETYTMTAKPELSNLIDSQNEECVSIACKPGKKFSQGKPIAGALKDFDLALIELSKLLSLGAIKYERSSWLNVPNAEEEYYDALWRHLLELDDVEGDLGHDVAVVFNALACLQLRLIKESNKEN